MVARASSDQCSRQSERPSNEALCDCQSTVRPLTLALIRRPRPYDTRKSTAVATMSAPCAAVRVVERELVMQEWEDLRAVGVHELVGHEHRGDECSE